MRPATAGLALLAASLASILLAVWLTPMFFLAWIVAAWGLIVLARQEEGRRHAVVALVVFGFTLALGLLALGLSFGFRDRALGGISAIGLDGIFVNFAILAPGIATSIVLAGRSGPARAWGIAGIVAGILTLLIVASQLWGDPIGGLIALTGVVLLLAPAAGLALALRPLGEPRAGSA